MSVPLETQTPPLAANCAVCGIPLVGLAAVFLRWRGIRRSPRNPNCCTQCGAHLEEGRLVEMTVVFADHLLFHGDDGPPRGKRHLLSGR